MINYKKYRILRTNYADKTSLFRAQYRKSWFSGWSDINDKGAISEYYERTNEYKFAVDRIKTHIGNKAVSQEIMPFTKLDLMP